MFKQSKARRGSGVFTKGYPKFKVSATEGGAAVVFPSASSALMPPKSLNKKRPVYGKDTGKFKISTTNIYDLAVTTCAASLPFESTTSLGTFYVPPFTTDAVAAQYPDTDPDTTGVYWHDVRARDPKAFYALTRSIRSPSNWTVQMNSLRSNGVEYTWSEEPGNHQDPYRRSYLAFKVDALGFNCCDPKQFNDLVQMYGHVKQGPTAVTFHFTDPPMGDTAVKRYWNLKTSGGTDFIGLPHQEERSVGQWQMIIIPPRKMASVSLLNLHGKANWDKLIDMGFKPRKVTKAVRIYCSNGGIDDQQMEYVLKTQEVTKGDQNSTAGELSIDGSNVITQRSVRPGKMIKHKYVDTERACQYYQWISKSAAERGSARSNQFNNILAQGYDCVPYGSAVVFCFAHYHGGDPTKVQRMTIPIEIHVDSFTKFKSPLLDQLDIDQLGKNPRLGSTD